MPPASNSIPAPQAPPDSNIDPDASPRTTAPQVPPNNHVQTNPLYPTPNQEGNRIDLSREPLLQDTNPRNAPPLPSLARPGVEGMPSLALSLDGAIRLALENNNDIEIARGDVKVAEGTLLSLEGVYDPLFVFTPSYTNSVVPTANSLNGANNAGTLRQSSFDFGPSVSKLFGVSGGQYQFFFNNLRQSTSSSTSRLSPFYSANAGVTFTQPLLRNRSIDRFRRDIRVQRRRVSQSDADFRLRTIDTIAQVQRAYWELAFALRNQQSRVDNLNLARRQFLDIEARVAEGTSAPIERAEVQTELSTREAELVSATRNVTLAENQLKVLTLRDALAPEWRTSIMPIDSPPFDVQPVNVEDALAEARQNRSELQRIRIEQDINRVDTQFFRDQTRPRIDLVSTVSSTGLAGSPSSFGTGTPINTELGASIGIPNGQTALIGGSPTTDANAFLLAQLNQLRQAQGLSPAAVPLIPSATLPENLVGGYGRTLRNLSGGDTRNIVVGVAIEIPFRNRGARGNLAVAQAQQEQLAASLRGQEQLVELEVRNAVQTLDAARRTVLISRSARLTADLQVTAERQLYQEGRSTTFLVFERENTLANARNLELRSEADYNTALADLQRATGMTLRAVNISLDGTTTRIDATSRGATATANPR